MRIVSAAAAALACLASSGCMSSLVYRQPVPLAEQADMFNTAAAEAERLMIVRNVMRGRDRSSMIFTRISQMRGAMTRGMTGSLGASIDEDSNNDGVEAELSMTGSTSPSFDFQVMNDEKFNRAMQTSIDLGVYELLQEYGWPRNLLHMLFIERVEEGGRVYNNYPDDWGAMTAFTNWVNTSNLRVCHADNPTRIGPPIIVSAGNDLEDFAALAGAKLSLDDQDNGTWQVIRARTDRFFASNDDCTSASGRYAALLLTLAGSGTTPSSGGGATGSIEIQTPPPTAEATTPERRPARRPTRAQTAAPATPPATPTRTIHVRSIQGVLYYLGEVVRAQHESGHVVEVTLAQDANVVRSPANTAAPASTPRPLFVVQRGTCQDGLNFVHEDGRRYSVPSRVARPNATCSQGREQQVVAAPNPGYSHQVMALVLQLIGIIQQREDAPATAAVQVVN